MGWGIDTVRPRLNKIFKEADRKYKITHPQQAHQGIVIEYLGDTDLPVRFKIQIANLFPESVYVDFVQVQMTAEIAKQRVWDN